MPFYSLVSGDREGQGFEEAFDVLFPRAFRLARRVVGDSAAAEDIAAEALARAYARWPRVVDLPYRDAWVLRVAANLSMDDVRRRRPGPAPAPAAGPDADDVVALRLALAAALSALPRRQREAVTLRYLGDLSDADVAGALGISAGSVKTHLHRGLAALRARLGPAIDQEAIPFGLE